VGTGVPGGRLELSMRAMVGVPRPFYFLVYITLVYNGDLRSPPSSKSRTA
jgi:hypothetical protein